MVPEEEEIAGMGMYCYMGPYLLARQVPVSLEWNCCHPALGVLEDDFWLPVMEEMDVCDEDDEMGLYLIKFPSHHTRTALIVLPNGKVPGISRRLLIPDASLVGVDRYYNKCDEISFFSKRYACQIKAMMSILGSDLVQITWGNVGITEPVCKISANGGNPRYH